MLENDPTNPDTIDNARIRKSRGYTDDIVYADLGYLITALYKGKLYTATTKERVDQLIKEDTTNAILSGTPS
jgi:hypothetical protein